ncbi:hypothetical protein V6N13_085237 [Hibiscus sabdariffa]
MVDSASGSKSKSRVPEDFCLENFPPLETMVEKEIGGVAGAGNAASGPVDAHSEIPRSVMVELENGFQVDVGVDWSRLPQSVNENSGFIDVSVTNGIVNIPVAGGFDSIPDADVTLVVEERVVAHIDEILGPETDVLSNINLFEVFDEDQETDVPSPRNGRLATEGVADLMNQLKPKGDFNIIQYSQESSNFDGRQHISGATQDFLDCLEEDAQKLVLLGPSAENIAMEREAIQKLQDLYKAEEKFLR